MPISSRTPEGRPNCCPVYGATLKIEPSDPAGDAPCAQCGQLLWFDGETIGDLQIVKPSGILQNPDSFDSLVEEIELRRRTRVDRDLSQVPYISSAVLARLIDFKKKVALAKGRVVLRRVPDDLRGVFQITGLDRLFDIDD
jgi:anti-anti-sigma factor